MAPNMDSYSGPVRILDRNGILLTVGSADLEKYPETGSWGGLLRVIANTGVAGKALLVKIDIPDVGTGEAGPRPPDRDERHRLLGDRRHRPLPVLKPSTDG
jgi:hypothetical protein